MGKVSKQVQQKKKTQHIQHSAAGSIYAQMRARFYEIANVVTGMSSDWEIGDPYCSNGQLSVKCRCRHNNSFMRVYSDYELVKVIPIQAVAQELMAWLNDKCYVSCIHPPKADKVGPLTNQYLKEILGVAPVTSFYPDGFQPFDPMVKEAEALLAMMPKAPDWSFQRYPFIGTPAIQGYCPHGYNFVRQLNLMDIKQMPISWAQQMWQGFALDCHAQCGDPYPGAEELIFRVGKMLNTANWFWPVLYNEAAKMNIRVHATCGYGMDHWLAVAKMYLQHNPPSYAAKFVAEHLANECRKVCGPKHTVTYSDGSFIVAPGQTFLHMALEAKPGEPVTFTNTEPITWNNVGAMAGTGDQAFKKLLYQQFGEDIGQQEMTATGMSANNPAGKLGSVFPALQVIVCCPVEEKARPKRQVGHSCKSGIYTLEYGIHEVAGARVSGCPVSDIIIHLNDKHRWSREQIADWLESLDVDLTMQAQSAGD